MPLLRPGVDSVRVIAPTAPAAVSLSNRRETALKSEDLSLGVDRLSVSFPLDGFEQDPTAWSSMSVRNPGTDLENTTYGTMVEGVFVGVMQHPVQPGVWIGKMETNPARVLDPDGWHGLPAARLREAVGVMGGRVSQLVQPAADIDESRVKRLDVCRDFATENPAAIVRGLGPVHRPWSRRNLVHFDPARSGAQTLMVGSASGIVRLYDKAAETNGRAPEGTLRWEVEARSQWLSTYGGIKKLSDITEDTVKALAEDRWRWSAMGQTVASQNEMVQRVMANPEISPTVKSGLIGYLTMQSMGCAYQKSSATVAKYRKLAKEMNLAWDPDPDGFEAARLDWERGIEINEGPF